MGNCIVHETPLHWAGEDWAPALSQPESGPEPAHVVVGARTKSRTCTEVKVKITKKQLEKLTRKLDGQAGLITVNQVVAQLIKESVKYETRSRPRTRQRLQTIPEIASSSSSSSSSSSA